MQKIPLARILSSISKGKKYQVSSSMGAAESFSLLGFHVDGFLIPDVAGEICSGLNLLPFCVLHCNPISHLLPGKTESCKHLLCSYWFVLYLTSCS